MVDYAFYTDKYMGDVIQETDFPRLIKRAGEQLAHYRRIYSVSEPEEGAENMAVCAMAEALHGFELIANGEGGVQSASIGSVSVSYGSAEKAVDMTPKGQAKELLGCASLYLDIYRGVC